MFEKDGKEVGKAPGNGKGNEENADPFFKVAKAGLTKKYGTDYTGTGMPGLTTLAWNHVTGCSVTYKTKTPPSRGRRTCCAFFASRCCLAG